MKAGQCHTNTLYSHACVCVGIDIDVDADVHIVFQDNTQCVSHQKCCCDLDLLDCVCVQCFFRGVLCFALCGVVLLMLF